MDLDPAAEARRIGAALHQQVFHDLRRKGVVLGISGGIDSSVTAALCVRALGARRVVGVLMPEHDSAPSSLELGRQLADHLGIETVVEDVAGILEAAGCYRRRDDALRRLVPAYGPGYKSKIVLPDLSQGVGYRIFSVVIQAPDGQLFRQRMPLDVYQEVVAATNFKQRVRKMMEYYHADRLRFAVAGTPNLLEFDQGFFVKNGDGAADVKPIAHLYKRQVYQLAAYLGIPAIIRTRPPTTDTYSLEQTQQEFFFSLPWDQMDVCLYGRNHGIPVDQIAAAVGLAPDHVERVYRDIDAKRQAARYLHQGPCLVSGPVPTGGEHAAG
ncbi:MAG: NAD(+) synthase [Planctomycetes bacterium RBG_16_64_10]|nr:MAG: NAD(+) synthase [Planctomycetes bacterium RBG_16_64_10]